MGLQTKLMKHLKWFVKLTQIYEDAKRSRKNTASLDFVESLSICKFKYIRNLLKRGFQYSSSSRYLSFNYLT